jgi:recombination protein RecA
LSIPGKLTEPQKGSTVGEEIAKLHASMLATLKKFKIGDFGRGLEGFRTRVAVQFQSTGIGELDQVLGGGFPRGSVVELCGSASSGRTSLAFSLLAKATEQQETCAFVDVSDSLDPLSLASAGVDLRRVLWIRCGEGEEAQSVSPSSVFVHSNEKVSAKESGRSREKPSREGSWRHPREEAHGVEEAIPDLMRTKSVQRDPKRISVVASCAGEQVERDRELPRRGIRPLLKLRAVSERDNAPKDVRIYANRGKPWKRMEQGLRTTELLLQSGGWGVIVLDLAGISWVEARKINLSLWFRFRRAVESTSTILLLVGEDSYAKTCASLVLRCGQTDKIWNHGFATGQSGVSTFEGFNVQAEVLRSRIQSPPGGSAGWRTLYDR